MVRPISRQRGGLAVLKLTKLFGIDDFPAAKDSGKVLIIIIYCYFIIAWIRTRVSFAIWRSALVCLRGSRSRRRTTPNVQETGRM